VKYVTHLKFPLFPQQIPERKLAAKSILEIAGSNPDFSTLTTLLGQAGFMDELSGPGPFTVFAPTNAAFDKLPAGTLSSLRSNLVALEDILDYHIVNGTAIMSTSLKVGMTAPTLEGSTVKVTSLSPVKINTATVISPDIVASNGVIHVIDSVLTPPPEVPSADPPSVESEDP